MLTVHNYGKHIHGKPPEHNQHLQGNTKFLPAHVQQLCTELEATICTIAKQGWETYPR